MMDPTGMADRPRPASLRQLFWAFSALALQGFGGVLAVVQRELVERKQWLSQKEFLEDWAVAQILPGPNVVNLSLMWGGRYFGWRGACVAHQNSHALAAGCGGFAGLLGLGLSQDLRAPTRCV